MHNIRCITRASLDALSDRSFRIRTRLEARFVLYKNFLCMDLFVFQYGNRWFEIRRCRALNWSSAHPKAVRWRSLDEIDRSKYTAGDRIRGCELFLLSNWLRLINWPGQGQTYWSQPPWLVTGKQDRDRFVIFVRMTTCHCLWLTGKKVYCPLQDF